MSKNHELSTEQKLRLESSKRFDNLWKVASEHPSAPILAEVVEPYNWGALRPEITEISARVGERVISVSNCQAVMLGEHAEVQGRLDILESIASEIN